MLLVRMCLLVKMCLVLVLLNITIAYTQSSFFLLPKTLLHYENQLAVINYQGKTLKFDLVHGWQDKGWQDKGWQDKGALAGSFHNHIHVDSKGVYLSQSVLDYLGLDLPKIKGMQFIQGNSTRLIFELTGQVELNSYIKTGKLSAGETLILELPPLLLSWGLPREIGGIMLELTSNLKQTTINLTVNQAMQYRVFSFNNPLRLVFDFTPINQSLITQEVLENTLENTDQNTDQERVAPKTPFPIPPFALEQPNSNSYKSSKLPFFSALTERRAKLRRGISYKRFAYLTEKGLSTIHILEVAPYSGEFRVISEPKVTHKLEELIRGGFAAINAGYFDPKTATAIGFLRLDYKTLSEPSRNRASIAFDHNRAVINRVYYQASVYLQNRTYPVKAPYQGGDLVVYARAGETFGSSERGTIVVAHNQVIENTTGPRIVPQNGFILSYNKAITKLTHIKSGDYARLEANITPTVFSQLRYAVEAGPLLVYNKKSVYQPSIEHFKDTYIVNGRTHQAAIGIKPDGTVLLLTASFMNAKELVPLFILLGADKAMRLDSGSSTSLFAAGQVLNRYGGRKIASAIVFFPYY